MNINFHWMASQNNLLLLMSTALIQTSSHLVRVLPPHPNTDVSSLLLDIRLNSYQYTQLHNRLLAPIRVARNVVIHQSLSDRFAAAFAEQVERNGEYFLPQGSAVGSILTDIWLVGQYACEGYSTQLCPQVCVAISLAADTVTVRLPKEATSFIMSNALIT